LLEAEFGEGDTIRAHAELGEIRFGRAEGARKGEPEPAEPVSASRTDLE